MTVTPLRTKLPKRPIDFLDDVDDVDDLCKSCRSIHGLLFRVYINRVFANIPNSVGLENMYQVRTVLMEGRFV